MKNDITNYTIRIYQIVFGLILLGLGYLALQGMMMYGIQAGVKYIAIVVFIILMLLLGKYYWIMAPLFLYCEPIWYPMTLPFQEMACLALMGMMIVRHAIFRERYKPVAPLVWAALPFVVWAMIIFMLNPCGIAMLGSTTWGLRSYMKIWIGFITMMSFSCLSLTEKDCRILFQCLLICILVAFIKGFFGEGGASDDGEVSENIAFLQYRFLNGIWIVTWLLSRYPLAMVVRSFPLVVVSLAFYGGAIYSGKRKAFFYPLIVLAWRAVVIPKERIIIAFAFFILAMFGTLFIAGHGRFYELPLSAQRALTVFPGKWDRRLDALEGANDNFRTIVHGYAKDIMRKNPWVGRRGFTMSKEEFVWLTVFGDGTSAGVFYGPAYAGNWHSLWYAIGADFGYTGIVLWGIFHILVLFVYYRRARTFKYGSYKQVMALGMGAICLTDWVFSMGTGSSSTTPFSTFIWFGLLLAIDPDSQGPVPLFRNALEMDNSSSATRQGIPNSSRCQ